MITNESFKDSEIFINFVVDNLNKGVFDYDISNWRSSRLSS